MGAACKKQCCQKKTDDDIVADEFNSPEPEPEPIKLSRYSGAFGGVPPIGYVDTNNTNESRVNTTENITPVSSEAPDLSSTNMLKKVSRRQSKHISDANHPQQSRYSNRSNSQYARLEKSRGEATQRNIIPTIIQQSTSVEAPSIIVNPSHNMIRNAQKASRYGYQLVNNQRDTSADAKINIASLQLYSPPTNPDPSNFSIYRRLDSADSQEFKVKLQQSRSVSNLTLKNKFGPLNYIGAWKGRLKHGLGTQTWPDGSVYQGSWVDGKACGQGKFKLPNGDVFDGQFNNDMANGKGILMRHDGSRFQGTWWDDLQHGTGIETWYNGSKYQGCYHKGKKHGYGRYVWPDKSQYTGDWQGNTMTGYGRITWSDGRKYDGELLNNQKHGSGRHMWPDGRKYQGQYRMDKRHGYGKLTLPDGSSFVGLWQGNMRQGKGVQSAPNGVSREGTWANGQLVNWIT